MSEDLEAAEGLEGDAVGRLDPMAAEAVTGSLEQLTPEDRAIDAELALISPRKWRRMMGSLPRLSCPLCGADVSDDHRAHRQHVEWHKDAERIRAACGLEPGHVGLQVDYAGLAERARARAHVAVVVAMCAMLAAAVVIVSVVLL